MRSLWALSLLLLSAAAFAEPGGSFTEPPDNVSDLEFLHSKAEQCVALNDFDGAISAYTEIILAEPDDDVAYSNLGQAYLVKGMPDKARHAFEQALDIDPENEQAQAGLRRLEDPDAPLL